MGAAEPRPRRRGFFFFSVNEEEPDSTEQDDPEGLINRLKLFRPRTQRESAGASRHSLTGGRQSGGRRLTPLPSPADDGVVQIRPISTSFKSATATGSRRRSRRRR